MPIGMTVARYGDSSLHSHRALDERIRQGVFKFLGYVPMAPHFSPQSAGHFRRRNFLFPMDANLLGLFVLYLLKCRTLSKGAVRTIFKVFGMTRSGFKPPTSQTQSGCSHHYTTEFLVNITIPCKCQHKQNKSYGPIQHKHILAGFVSS